MLGHPLHPWSEEAALGTLGGGSRRKRAFAGAGVGLVIYASVVGALLGFRGPAPVETARFTALQTSRPGDFDTTSRNERRKGSAQPKALVVWRLGIYAPIGRMGLMEDGTLEVPDDAQDAGWFEGGPPPGRPGPAVIVGHYDSRTGPGVFFPLKKLRVGDEVGVTDASGNDFVFVVTRIEQVDKDLFPTDSVYERTAEPNLRLITCKGDIDPVTGHYTDNLIAYAKLVD